MTFRILFSGLIGAVLISCQTAPRGGDSAGQICYRLQSEYRERCNFTDESDRRDCVIRLKAAAMERVNLRYPDDPDDPAAAAERSYLISSINYCDVRMSINPGAGTGPVGYWNAAGPDIYGQSRRCEGVNYDLEFTSLGGVIHSLCDIADLKRMTNWRLDGPRLVLFNNGDEIIIFKRSGGHWRSLDGAIEIYR